MNKVIATVAVCCFLLLPGLVSNKQFGNPVLADDQQNAKKDASTKGTKSPNPANTDQTGGAKSVDSGGAKTDTAASNGAKTDGNQTDNSTPDGSTSDKTPKSGDSQSGSVQQSGLKTTGANSTSGTNGNAAVRTSSTSTTQSTAQTAVQLDPKTDLDRAIQVLASIANTSSGSPITRDPDSAGKNILPLPGLLSTPTPAPAAARSGPMLLAIPPTVDQIKLPAGATVFVLPPGSTIDEVRPGTNAGQLPDKVKLAAVPSDVNPTTFTSGSILLVVPAGANLFQVPLGPPTAAANNAAVQGGGSNANSRAVPATKTITFFARLAAIDEIGNIAASNAVSGTSATDTSDPNTKIVSDCVLVLKALLVCPNLQDYEEALFLIHVVNAIGQCGTTARYLAPDLIESLHVDPALYPVVTKAMNAIGGLKPPSTAPQNSQQGNQQNAQQQNNQQNTQQGNQQTSQQNTQQNSSTSKTQGAQQTNTQPSVQIVTTITTVPAAGTTAKQTTGSAPTTNPAAPDGP